MLDKMAYRMFSLSPLMINVEYLLTLGCNNVALKWKEEDWIFKDPLHRIMNHAGPIHPIQSEWYIITIWYPNKKIAEGYV